MYRHPFSLAVFSFVVLALVCDVADAVPRRWRATRNYRYNVSSGGLKKVAPQVDDESADYPSLEVYYSYNRSKKPEFAFRDKIRVFLLIRDDDVSTMQDDVVAEAKITDVCDYKKEFVRYFPISIQKDLKNNYTLATFDIVSDPGDEPIIEPAKVYRIFINLHHQSTEYGRESVIGRVPSPYYVATSGDSPLQQARQQIVMRTFKEFYFRKRGWPTKADYPMDCYAYYMWATGFCTVGAENGRTVLGKLFNRRTPYHKGSHIKELNEKGPIHADYVRKPGHSFMLLSYDPKAKHVWTMEGNFGRSIEVVIRSVSSGWKVGHLVEEHIRPESLDDSATQ